MFKYSRIAFWLTLCIITCIVLIGPAVTANAQGPDSNDWDTSENYCAPGIACNPAISPARRFEMAGAAALLPSDAPSPEAGNAQNMTSDPFGYALNLDTYNWIDATSGTNTDMKNSGYGQKIGPVALPFPFRFYENKYNNVYIAAEGFISFDANAAVPIQGLVPQVTAPNNLIAPYWAPFYLSGKGKKGNVFYASGGTAPNRYFVVEWNAVPGGPSTDATGSDDSYTFEVILHENGDIVFQYGKMNFKGRYYCGVAGIESSDGLTGINSLVYCKTTKSKRSIRFTRPTPAARVQVLPTDTGTFGAPGTTTDIHATIRNVGDLGADTYNAGASFTENWDAAVFADDGVTPLTQVGPLDEGEARNIIVRVHVPNDAVVGNSGAATLYVSSTTSGAHAEQNIATGVTSDFAAVYHTNDNRAMSLELVRDNVQTILKVTPDNYNGSYPGLVRKANDNYVYAWLKSRCVTSNCSKVAQELEYAVLDTNGSVVEAIRKIRPLASNPKNPTYQYSYGMASATDGYTGFAWVQEEDAPNGKWNQSVVFATTDPGGNHTYSARELTKNSLFGNDTTENVPFYYNARVVARPDNTFMVIWQRRMLEGGKWSSNIYYEILDHASKVIKKETAFTKAKPGDGYYVPGAVGLPDGKVLIAFTRVLGTKEDLYAGVVGSDGKTFLAPKLLSGDAVNDWAYTTAARTSDGNILLAWTAFGNGNPFIRMMTLDSSFNAVGTPYTIPTNSRLGDGTSSITTDEAGHGIVMIAEYNASYRHTLYQVLVHPTELGNTYVIPFQYSTSYISSSFSGQGIAR